MKFAAACVGALALAASAAAPARAVTVTELVGALCPDIAGAVTDPKGNLKTLYAALGALGDVDIGDVPASAVILAPTDDAFAAALESLGMTAEELLADTDLLGKIVLNHVAADVDGVVTTLAGEVVDLGGDLASLSAPFAVKAAASSAEAVAVVPCAKQGQTAIVVDAVVVPAALAGAAEDEVSMPGMAPAPAAEMAEEMAPDAAATVADAAQEAAATVADKAQEAAATVAATVSSAGKAAVAGAAVLAAALLA